MKKNKKNKSGKTSIQSMIRMSCPDNMKHSIVMSRLARISDYGFNEILPEILIPEVEIIKKIKKKKQNNTKKENSKQIYKKLIRGIH